MQELGAELDEAADVSVAAVQIPRDDPGFVEFVVTGTDVRGEFRCGDCGYGVVVQRALPPCPMCGSLVWESRGPLELRPLD